MILSVIECQTEWECVYKDAAENRPVILWAATSEGEVHPLVQGDGGALVPASSIPGYLSLEQPEDDEDEEPDDEEPDDEEPDDELPFAEGGQ